LRHRVRTVFDRPAIPEIKPTPAALSCKILACAGLAWLTGEVHKTQLSDLLRWRASLEAIARTGMEFTPNVYDRERFEEILKIALEMGNGEALFPPGEDELIDLRDEDNLSIAARYVTPKIGVSVAIGDDQGRLLLNKRAASGQWGLVGGYADVGYSAAEVAIKEAKEEVGLDIEVTQLIALGDGLQSEKNPIPQYGVMLAARVVGSKEMSFHPREVSDAGWFTLDTLPSPIVHDDSSIALAFEAIEGRLQQAVFDAPRPERLRELHANS